MPAQLIDPVAHICDWLTQHTGRMLIGLAGTPGSGKSTLAQQIQADINARFAAEVAVALGMDGFHLSKAQLAQMPNPAEAFARRGAPWTFDAAGFRQHIMRVRSAYQSQAVTWPDFAHEVGDPMPDAIVVPATAQVVIVEGLYVLYQGDEWAGIHQLFDECWFLDTPYAIAIERLAQRHMQAWGFTRAQAEHRIATSDGLNAQLVQASAVHANWLVSARELSA